MAPLAQGRSASPARRLPFLRRPGARRRSRRRVRASGRRGGTGSVTVSVASGCTWTATTANPDWLTITGGSTGSGGGAVAFTAAANTGAARTGTLTIAGQPFTVNEAAACAFTIAPTTQNVDSAGGAGSVTVTTDGGCAWTASSNNPDWISVTGGASGTGDGTVSFSAAANAGVARSGTLTIAGQILHRFTGGVRGAVRLFDRARQARPSTRRAAAARSR